MATIIPIHTRRSSFKDLFPSGGRVIAASHSFKQLQFALVSVTSELIVGEVIIRPFYSEHQLVMQNDPPDIGDIVHDVLFDAEDANIDIVGLNPSYVTSTLDDEQPPRLTLSITRLTERRFTLVGKNDTLAPIFAHLPELAVKRVNAIHPSFSPLFVFEGGPSSLTYMDILDPIEAAFAPLHGEAS